MKGFAAFLKKEIMEAMRSYRALILLLVFLLFGFISPGLAKIMPDIFSKIPLGNVTITLPPSTYMDAYAQFFKNMTQMGMIVLLLIFATSMPHEVSKGTLIMPLSKGLSRDAVILAKYSASLLLWTVGYLLAAVVDVGYTWLLFGIFSAPQLLLSFFSLWIFGAFLLSFLLFSGCVASGNYGGLLLSVGILFLLMLLNIVPAIGPYNPLYLASANYDLLLLHIRGADMIPSIAVSVTLTVGMIAGALAVFRKKML
jgi:ABC-2 type transport system permease protein